MNSPWDRRTRIRRSGRCAIRWRRTAFRADRAAVRRPRWRRGRRPWHWGRTPAGPSGNPLHFAAWGGGSPPPGAAPAHGLTAFASSLDHIGPLARTVRDAAVLLRAIAGRDPLDVTSAEAPVPDYTQSMDGNVKGLKLGLPREYQIGRASCRE